MCVCVCVCVCMCVKLQRKKRKENGYSGKGEGNMRSIKEGGKVKEEEENCLIKEDCKRGNVCFFSFIFNFHSLFFRQLPRPILAQGEL